MRVPSGVMLTEVDASRFANLKHVPVPGDILARVNCERPKSPEHLVEILENTSPKSAMDLVILRREKKENNNTFIRIDFNNWMGK